jgi:integrase
MRINRLSARQVETVKNDGVYFDGAGLYLRVRGTARSWFMIYQWDGRRREMGLGAPPAISLARARALAQAARELLADGRDPIAERKNEKKRPTFGPLADEWIEARKGSVRNSKSIDRWNRTLGSGGYADALREKRVDQITTEDVVTVLKPIWSKGATATVAKGYIESVIDAATARKLRTGPNPARWKGHIEHLLPKPQKLARGHHAAMPYAEVPAFMTALRATDGLVARALEFTILTAARAGEVLGATMDEFDTDAGLWTIPATRMKAGKTHVVPLVGRSLEIVLSLKSDHSGLLFPGGREGRPISNMTCPMLMRRMKVAGTVHGFRSAFRDWAGDKTNHAEDIAEAALAHARGGSVERAYRRGSALEKRRALMADWDAYCLGAPAGQAANINEPASQAAEETAAA